MTEDEEYTYDRIRKLEVSVEKAEVAVQRVTEQYQEISAKLVKRTADLDNKTQTLTQMKRLNTVYNRAKKWRPEVPSRKNRESPEYMERVALTRLAVDYIVKNTHILILKTYLGKDDDAVTEAYEKIGHANYLLNCLYRNDAAFDKEAEGSFLKQIVL